MHGVLTPPPPRLLAPLLPLLASAAIVAMSGKNCVAIAADRRLGAEQTTVATDFEKTFKIHDRLFVGLPGLATDTITLYV